MKLAYLDSCICITRCEGIPVYKTSIDQKLQTLTDEGWSLCISEIVLLETLLKPLKNNQTELVQKYRDLFKTMRMLNNYAEVFQEALQIAQTENFNVIDAIHVALATHYDCHLFVSSDPHFRHLRTMTPAWIDLSQNFTIRTAITP